MTGQVSAGRPDTLRRARHVRSGLVALGPVVLGLAALAALLAACAGGREGEGARAGSASPELVVAAASDLRFAFEELGERFEAATGTRVRFSFGSSGLLAAQIANGAPFDVFASADVGFVERVLAAGRGDADTRTTYAFGRIVLWQPGEDDPPDSVGELAEARFRRVAVANPEHAPYGRAAVEALRSAGVDGVVADRLVYGDNVSDALRLATSGNVDVAIVALSLAIATDGGRYTVVPEAQHDPLEQALVVTTGESGRAERARAFVEHLAGPEGREVMVRHGFVLPGEDPAPDGGVDG